MNDSPGHGYTIRFDAESGVVRVALGRDVPDEAFADYRDELSRAVDEAHLHMASVRVLIDGRELETMPVNSADRIQQLAQVFGGNDRIAMIVRSSVLKMEARQLAHAPTVQTFLSENAAWTWLLAYDVPSSSAA